MLLLLPCLTALLVESHGDLLQFTNTTTYNLRQNSIYLYIYNNHILGIILMQLLAVLIQCITTDSDSYVVPGQ